MKRVAVAAGAVLCLLCFGAVGSGAAGSVAENASVALQDPGAVAVASDIQTGDETELLVELADGGGVTAADASGSAETTVAQLQERAAVSQSGVRTFAAQTPGVAVENRFWLTNAVLVRVDTDRVPVRALARIEGVESVTRNARVRALDSGPEARHSADAVSTGGVTASTGSVTTSTAETGDVTAASTTAAPATTYGLDQIDAPVVWSRYDTRGAGTSVAVLDTGVDPNHPDIDLAEWAEFGVLGDTLDTEPQDYNDHGTHVSGTVAGGNAGGEHIGVAPDTTLSHGAVLTNCNDGECTGFLSQIIAGMEWAVENDVDVVSMSLSLKADAFGYIDAVRNAEKAGTTVVAAIGNNGEGTSGSPGSVYDAMSAGASNANERIASFSSGEQVNTDSAWGPGAPNEWPDQYIVPTVAAPGANVESAVPGGGYESKWGTSMATPHVAGAIALVESATEIDPTPDEIMDTLEATADKPASAPAPAGERDTRYGSGIVNVSAAVESFRTRPPTFRVRSLQPQSVAVTNGTTLELSAEIANRGSQTDTQTVALAVDEVNQTRTETLAPGANTTVTFTIDTGALGPGTYTSTIASANDSASGTLAVQTPAAFEVTITDTSAPVVAGASLSVNVTLENTGGASDTQTVELDAGPLGTDVTTVSLNGTASTTVTLGVPTTVGDYGTQTLTVSSANDTATSDASVSMQPLVAGPPTDPDGDGLYEDVRGDGNLSLLDVQALFEHLHSDVVRTNSAAFNFQEFDSEVNILDVQVLFNLLSS